MAKIVIPREKIQGYDNPLLVPIPSHELRAKLGFAPLRPINQCDCRRCLRERDERTPEGFPIETSRMILCPKCGNKRCPHASDHRYDCTDSNAVGQPGSVYRG